MAKGGRDDSAPAEETPIDDGFDEISGLDLNVEDEVLAELEKLGTSQAVESSHDPYDTKFEVSAPVPLPAITLFMAGIVWCTATWNCGCQPRLRAVCRCKGILGFESRVTVS